MHPLHEWVHSLVGWMVLDGVRTVLGSRPSGRYWAVDRPDGVWTVTIDAAAAAHVGRL